jgi:hypothetical protein
MGGIISKPKAPTPAPSNYLKPPAPAAAPAAAPTTAEVSQASATDMDNKGIKRRRRGRSMTILTGSAGVQEGATLGTPTLLG